LPTGVNVATGYARFTTQEPPWRITSMLSAIAPTLALSWGCTMMLKDTLSGSMSTCVQPPVKCLPATS
jgi:hypothetical protein